MRYRRATGRDRRYPGGSSGRLESTPSDRYRFSGGDSLTPERVAAIMAAADSGDTAQLAWTASRIELENWDIRHAMETRRNALAGCPRRIVPGGPGREAAAIAEAFAAELASCGGGDGLDGFDELLNDLESAVIAPFSASEIVWNPGGSLAGFRPVDGWHFTFRESFRPLLVTEENPEGVELPPEKLLFHSLRRGGDPVRRGLVRTLAWLHVFQNFPIKDLLSFVERYGMPFVVARVDRNSWENERAVLAGLVRNFGPSGGGVFTRATELELLQASGSSGEVYFRLLEYTGGAITKLLLGQLASSSDSGGLSGGDAQSRVRDDIRRADARALQNTINAQLAVPWTRFRYGRGAVPPRLEIDAAPPEDRRALAEMVLKLHEAGLEADPVEIGERVGLHLTRIPR